MLCEGIEKVAIEQDINTIYFMGGNLGKSPDPYAIRSNIIYNLADSSNVDGLIISSAIISNFITKDKMEEFVKQYKDIPKVSLGMSIPDTINILINNKKGMKEVISHLIEVHKIKKIAFIKGPEDNLDAKIRFRAYQEILEELNIPYDPELVIQGNFTGVSGKNGTVALLDNGIDFKAIVAANDEMALGAIHELKKRGYGIPKDFLVVGFDNIFTSKFSTPSLTTVKQPIYEQGRKAMETIISLVKGQDKVEDIILSTKLVIHKSCGCYPKSMVENILDTHLKSKESESDLAIDLNKIISEIQKSNIYENFKMNPILVQDLLTTFIEDISGKKEDFFLKKLNELVDDLITIDSDLKDWKDILSMFKNFSLIYKSNSKIKARAEYILLKANNLINDTIEQFDFFKSHQDYKMIINYARATTSLNSCYDLSKINDIISETFPRLGLNYTYISLYEGETLPPEETRLIAAFNLNKQINLPEKGVLFKTKQLIPDDFFPKNERYSFFIESLHFRNEPQYGFAIYELKPDIIHFDLRGHLGNTIKGAFLQKELTDLKNKS